LIARGADMSAKNNHGDTPLHWACMNGQTEIVQILIDRGADISSNNYM
jgi:ankyrin repeat protein